MERAVTMFAFNEVCALCCFEFAGKLMEKVARGKQCFAYDGQVAVTNAMSLLAPSSDHRSRHGAILALFPALLTTQFVTQISRTQG
jgi:hypothetical protein